ncbi:hypothetical protein [Acinetobacter puyangensis]|uniref:hypothetical protein n=1 Tax=Acinetobacter puyangensis TaxID=1096779 RepID=UPI003A4E2B1D
MTYSTVKGTAFATTALKDAIVTAICKDNVGFTTEVKVDAQGQWQGKIDNSKFPCRLEVKSANQTYHSYVTQVGYVNINPLTDLAIASASSQIPSTWYKTEAELSNDKIKSANLALINELNKKDYSVNSQNDLFITEINADDQTHQTIAALLNAIDKSSSVQDYQALVTLIKDGNLNQIPNKIKDNIPNLSNKITLDLSACKPHSNTNQTFHEYCSENVLVDFKEEQLISTSGQKCTLSKEQNTLTITDGKTTVSTLINNEEDDYVFGDGENWTLVAKDSNNTNISMSWNTQDGWVGLITAQSLQQESLVCASTRPRK